MSIWNHKEIRKSLHTNLELKTLNEGFTPLSKLKQDNYEILIKREDLNPSKSPFDRAVIYRLNNLGLQSAKEIIAYHEYELIPSLIKYLEIFKELKLHIFTPESLDSTHPNILFYKSENPKEDAYNFAKEKNLKIFNDDEDFKIAFRSLGLELGAKLKKEENNTTGILIPDYYSNMLDGLAQGLQIRIDNEFNIPHIYIIKTLQKSNLLNSKIIRETRGGYLSVLNKKHIDIQIGDLALTSNLELGLNAVSTNNLLHLKRIILFS